MTEDKKARSMVAACGWIDIGKSHRTTGLASYAHPKDFTTELESFPRAAKHVGKTAHVYGTSVCVWENDKVMADGNRRNRDLLRSRPFGGGCSTVDLPGFRGQFSVF